MSKLYQISMPDGSGEYIYISEDEAEVKAQMDDGETIDGIYELSPILRSALPENRRLEA